MDYREILMHIEQNMTLYVKAVLKKEFGIAQVYAKAINELTADLLFLTRGMK